MIAYLHTTYLFHGSHNKKDHLYKDSQTSIYQLGDQWNLFNVETPKLLRIYLFDKKLLKTTKTLTVHIFTHVCLQAQRRLKMYLPPDCHANLLADKLLLDKAANVLSSISLQTHRQTYQKKITEKPSQYSKDKLNRLLPNPQTYFLVKHPAKIEGKERSWREKWIKS